MKTTERIVRLNDESWLYEITTEDPEVLTAPFTVRYPMRRDPDYIWPEYACHEDNTIVRFTLPNNAPWDFSGEISAHGAIAGVVSSSQGGLPVTFRRTSGAYQGETK